jgi:Predicted membrane protein
MSIRFICLEKDKKLSKDHKWRISENKLLFVCFIGGSIGGLLGMKNFSHKTKEEVYDSHSSFFNIAIVFNL